MPIRKKRKRSDDFKCYEDYDKMEAEGYLPDGSSTEEYEWESDKENENPSGDETEDFEEAVKDWE